MTSSLPKTFVKQQTTLPRPAFHEGPRGRLFTLARGPDACEHALLLIPPFGEEINRCRRLIHRISTYAAAQGTKSLYFEPYATGESDGDCHQARWEHWVEECALMYRHLEMQGHPKISMIAIRLGALLASRAIEDHGLRPRNLISIAPQFNGQSAIRHLLRTKLAAEQFSSSQYGTSALTMNQLRAQMLSKDYIEISGYQHSPALLNAIENAPDHIPGSTRNIIINVVAALQDTHDNTPHPDKSVHNHDVIGPPVWAQMEPQNPDALAEKALELFNSQGLSS